MDVLFDPEREMDNDLKTELYRYDTILGFIDKIVRGTPFTFVKFGDGELLCMSLLYSDKYNADGSYYQTELGLHLLNSYRYFLEDDDTTIAKWSYSDPLSESLDECFLNKEFKEKFCYYDLLIHKMQNGTFDWSIVSFFICIKQSKRHKIYVCNEKLAPYVKQALHIDDIVIVPERTSYDEHDDIYSKLLPLIRDDTIVLTSTGMYAKYLICCLKKIKNATYIDCGSTFDGYYHASRVFHREDGYKDLLNKTYIG